MEIVVKDIAKPDKHYPNWYYVNPLRRLFVDPLMFNIYVQPGQTAADIGCGPGFFTLPLAEAVGYRGQVYAIDSNRRAVDAVRRRADRQGINNVIGVNTSAAHLELIDDSSVDFILGYGLMCSLAPADREQAVSEIKRILKPGGKAYLNALKGGRSYLDDAEWQSILDQFKVEWRSSPVANEYAALLIKKK